MRRLDNKRQLIEYFKRNLSKSYDSDTLKFALVKQGYSRVAVDQALEQARKELAAKAPVLKEKPVIRYSVYDQNDKPIHISPLSFWDKLKLVFKGKK